MLCDIRNNPKNYSFISFVDTLFARCQGCLFIVEKSLVFGEFYFRRFLNNVTFCIHLDQKLGKLVSTCCSRLC